MRRRFVLAVALMLLATCLVAQEKMRIAILDLNPEGIDASSARMVSDLLRTELFNTGLFVVVERGEMDKILGEQGLQSSGCTDAECAVEIGKMLAASKMLVGTVGKLGEAYIINARIVDVEKGTIEFATSTQSPGETELVQAVKEFAGRLSVRMRGGEVVIPQPVPARSHPYRTIGMVTAGVGLAIGGFGLFEHVTLLNLRDEIAALETELAQLKDEYDSMQTGLEEFETAWGQVEAKFEELEPKYDRQDTPASLATLGYSVGGALLTAGAILWLYPGRAAVTVRFPSATGIEVSHAF